MNESFFLQALVWVRLLELPLEFWNEDVFVGVARSFGMLLSIDLTTASKRCLSYAHICIGVGEGVDMPEVVTFHSKLGVHNQKLIYETIPFACFHCLKSRHKANQCPKSKVERKKSNHVSISGKDNLGKDMKKVWK